MTNSATLHMSSTNWPWCLKKIATLVAIGLPIFHMSYELRADDYICPPFSPREVVARVKAILRRMEMTKSHASKGYAGITIDEDKFVASIGEHKLDLKPVEFRLFSRLAGHPGRVFSRDQLMDKIYIDERVVSDRIVDSHVKNL